MTDAAEPAPTAPAVVAVVATCDPGPWLEEALAALGASDYPNLAVLVVDAGSVEDPTGRIAAVLPAAYVRRVDEARGFAATANEVLGVVEGASHFVFLHDDAAPDPDAIRLLVEEAYRSNAGIVAPKLVEWDRPARLLAVGATADKTGVPVAYGRGELDQEQHDAVRDVLVAPGGCQLVRADLFETLGGFDPAIVAFGEDVDLSWRAQLAGARVVVAPSARVRHLEAAGMGDDPPDVTTDADRQRLRLRHRVRTVLKAYGPLRLVGVVPQLVALMAAEALLSGRATWRATIDAWRWNLGNLGELRAARRQAQRVRLVRDGEIRRLQTRGSTRMAAAVRGGLAAEEGTLGGGRAGRRLAGVVSAGGLRLTIGVWASLAVVLALGSRDLIGGPLPSVGQLVPFPDSPLDPLRLFVSGWRPAGLGSESPAPFAFALLGAGGAALLGGMGLLQKLLVLGAIPAGIVGAHRLTAPILSWRARLVGVLLYAAVPLPYDAMARGRWSGLLAYAAMPWLMARLLRASGLPPFGAPAGDEETATARATRRRLARRREPGPRTPADAVEALLGAEAGTLDAVDAEELRIAAIAVAGRGHGAGDAGRVDEPADGPAGFDGLDGIDGPGDPWRHRAVAAVPAAVRWPGTFGQQAVAAAVLVAVVTALAPPFALAVLVTGAGLGAGCFLAGEARASGRALGLAAAAVGGAAVLLVPWTFELLAPGATWEGIAGLGVPPDDAPGLGELLRLHTGSLRGGPLSWGLLVAAALPLVVGRRWRFTWAARLWVVALVALGAAWAAGRGWLGVPPPAVDALLAPAAVALVLAGALGLAAFEADLPGYRFGWRQVASVAAAVAGVAATLPVVATAVDGRWRLPDRDFHGLLSWMPEQVEAGDFRVLWVAAPDVLPGDGWSLSDGLAYGTSRNGPPVVTDLWPGSDEGATGLLADSLAVARRGETSRLGSLLGPLGVRYVAVPLAAAPQGERGLRRAPPEGVVAALAAQVDLELVDTDESLVLFENAAWRPVRSGLDPGSSPLRSTGPVPAGELVLAEASSPGWRLTVDGAVAPRQKALGWANSFTVATAGTGTLEYRTSPVRYLALALQAGLWVGALTIVARLLRRRASARRAAEAEADAAAEAAAEAAAALARRPHPLDVVAADEGAPA